MHTYMLCIKFFTHFFPSKNQKRGLKIGTNTANVSYIHPNYPSFYWAPEISLKKKSYFLLVHMYIFENFIFVSSFIDRFTKYY